jgi:hypothetical protein
MLIGIDYPSKTIKATKVVMPSGDMKADMKEIKSYFVGLQGRHPDQFSVGEM